MKEIMKKLMEVFLSLHFLISMAFGICGLILEPGGRLWYEAMFAPAVMALLCTIPALLTIGTNKLTAKQILLRKVFQFLLEEGIVLPMIHFVFHEFSSIGDAVTVAVSVLLVFVGVYLIDWVRGCMEAEELNRRLAQLQEGK